MQSKIDNNSQVIKFDFQTFLVETWNSDDQRPAIYDDAPTMDWSGHLWKGLR